MQRRIPMIIAGLAGAALTATLLATGSGPAAAAPLPTSDTPDLGPNVKVYDPSVPASTIQADVDRAFNDQLRSPTAQFGTQRHVFLFRPGTYGRVFANLGFYTSVAGLGRSPDDVTIRGAINVDAGWNYGDERNATQNFWRSMENLAIEPEGGTNRWAVSQAAPMRRIHVRGNLTLAPSNQDVGQGYSSGGYLADSRVDGTISSGSQQQWYTRDSSIGRWEGGVWNMVFSGVRGAPPNAFPSPPHTTLATTPVTREKPFLYTGSDGRYSVFVPGLRRESSGASWPDGGGTSIPMREFYVARPGDSAERINAALEQGLNLFFTPGTYALDQAIRVTRPNTVVTGIGFPTLVPTRGNTAMAVADVDGVKVSGLTFDAGTTNSPTLMTVGTEGVHTDHAANPISLQDVFFRIGSSIQGNATTTLAVHADDTIIDHIWAWRADHGGAPTGWTVNKGDTGLVVNGDDVLATGLFVEHYQKYEVIWNGNRGRTIFFQNEKPYDVPDQAAWIGPRGNGYAAYKVGDGVAEHQLWGGGVYSFFNVNPAVRVDRGFEVPDRPGVRLRSVLTVSLGDVGTIANVVNDTGGSVPNPAGNTVPRTVVEYAGTGGPPPPSPSPTPPPSSPPPSPSPSPSSSPPSSPPPSSPPPSEDGTSAFGTIQAEGYADQGGVRTEPTSDSGGGENLAYLANGDWAAYRDIDFGAGASQFQARVASGAGSASGLVEVRLDSRTAAPVGSFATGDTGGWQSWRTVPANVARVTGRHTVYLTFTSGQPANYVNVNWFTFRP